MYGLLVEKGDCGLTFSADASGLMTFSLYYFKLLMSNFLDIDFVIKLNDKKSRRFDLSEVIFKCE